ncbi:MAG: hypothetical protein ACR2QU_12785 [Gammaproteobacteria bacterium]
MTDKEQNSGIEDALLTSSYDRLKEVQPPASLDRRVLKMAADATLSASGRGASFWSIWRYRLAAAATIVLAVSVTLSLLTDTSHVALPEPGLVLSEDEIQVRHPSARGNRIRLSEEMKEVERPSMKEPQAATQTSADTGAMRAVQADRKAPQSVSEKTDNQSNVATPEMTLLESRETVAARMESPSPRDALADQEESAAEASWFAEELRARPDDWLVAIDELLEDGEVGQARREIELFRERWPDRKLDAKYDID